MKWKNRELILKILIEDKTPMSIREVAKRLQQEKIKYGR